VEEELETGMVKPGTAQEDALKAVIKWCSRTLKYNIRKPLDLTEKRKITDR
jgi:hypothetical protein